MTTSGSPRPISPGLTSLRRLAACRRGSIATMAAFLTIPMIGAIAVGVDLARLSLVRSRLQVAVDAAALTYGRAIDAPAAPTEATAVYWSNFGRGASKTNNAAFTNGPGYLGAAAAAPVFTKPDTDTIRVTGTAEVKTVLIGVLANGAPTGSLLSNVVTAQAAAKRAAFGMELALVLDITGSMGRSFKGDGVTRDTSTNINAMRQSATDLVDILFGTKDTQPNLFVSVAPFTATVNIGANNAGWLAAGVDQSKYGGVNWKGCVEARAGGEDQTDTPPGTQAFTPYLNRSTLGVYKKGLVPVRGDNDWAPGVITEAQQATLPDNTAVGPNLGCPAIAIQPLTTSKATVMTAINALVSTYRGGTTGNLGLQAGWWTISPRWAGLWPGTPTTGLPNGATSLPLPYGALFMKKVVVFMTDGQNEWYDWPSGAPGNAGGDVDYDSPPRVADADYTAYGRLSENRLGLGTVSIGNAKAVLDSRTASMCAKMKAAGITIYTIILSASTNIDAATQSLWQNCASQPSYYFISPNQAALAASFKQIGLQLSPLRLAQ